jgi:hypothetical protein
MSHFYHECPGRLVKIFLNGLNISSQECFLTVLGNISSCAHTCIRRECVFITNVTSENEAATGSGGGERTEQVTAAVTAAVRICSCATSEGAHFESRSRSPAVPNGNLRGFLNNFPVSTSNRPRPLPSTSSFANHPTIRRHIVYFLGTSNGAYLSSSSSK